MLNRRDFLAFFGLGGAAWLSSGFRFPGKLIGTKEEKTMAYAAMDFGKLLGMPGFSDTLLKNHLTLYQGYVTNTNKSLDTQSQMFEGGKAGTPEYAEIKRRLGWEWNGMRLHELYFGNLGGKVSLDLSGKLAAKISAEFGSVESWEKEFRAVGAMRGIGWVVLYLDPASGRMFNSWINEHDGGHPAGATPVLVMDVFEHAYMTDYGIKKADYIEAFFKNIDWVTVASRIK